MMQRTQGRKVERYRGVESLAYIPKDRGIAPRVSQPKLALRPGFRHTHGATDAR